MVSYCNSTRRICVGAKNGGVAFYELKQSKCQVNIWPIVTAYFDCDIRMARFKCTEYYFPYRYYQHIKVR